MIGMNVIYGKTHKQKSLDEEITKEKLKKGVLKFAWWPKILDNGQRIWLAKYVEKSITLSGRYFYISLTKYDPSS